MGEYLWIIILIGIIVAIIIGVVNASNRGKEISHTANNQDTVLKNNGVRITAEYSWTDSLNYNHIRFIVDDQNKMIHIAQGISTTVFKDIPYGSIVGFEIICDSQVVGGVKRAIVGGLLAGGAGAIVGTMTAKKEIFSYKLVIYTDNISTPDFTINIINKKTKTTDSDFINAQAFAEKINATIKAIISQNDKVVSSNTTSGSTSLKQKSFVGKNQKVVYCRKCGAKMPNDSVFCPSCGERIKSTDEITLHDKNETIEEKTLFDVELTNVGPEKVKAIKIVLDNTGLNLKDAKELVDSTPAIIKKGVTKATATDIVKQFESVGAKATIK